MKGSMTVEASLIFPFCFVVIGIVCILGIYQYNQAVLKMTGYESILQTMEERKEEEGQFKELLLKRAEQAAKDRTFGLEEIKVSLKMSSTKISLSYEGSQSIIKVPMRVTVVYERIYPELTLRVLRDVGGE
ncbi:MAG: hypothetical protein J6B94_04815 [Lachnospiraceae bacterium]|nr:hypothetical protein [Lachnospiraceae bacterium]